MTTGDGWPRRGEAEARWLGVLDGSVNREEVHDWTVAWVEGKKGVGAPVDTLVEMALQYLHGFALQRSPGSYLKSLADVRSDLEYWRAECSDYDSDPIAWRARRQATARAAIERESNRG